ncbi:DctP family TRAP transporter solute-binding subunit [Acidisphaera sp. L21]|uniref:DctP family TRAP transporter solute-binding subunit n=1 Tax=Acidisphaera sp. L21 TaxID=1641851 RepID=UPI00131D8A9A|nr:DctP family TRAP transporter solute-binding subunit [Acidisphaera sp. L21]
MIIRRSLLAGLAALPLARPFVARAQTAALRVSTAAPPSDFLSKSLEGFKEAVNAANAGIKVDVFPASTLFKQGTEVPALQRGTLEMSTMTTFEVAQQIPEMGLFNRAYLFRDYDHLRRVFDGPVGTDYRALVADKMGIVILATTYLGTRHVNLRQARHVAAPADLSGVKMRMPAGPEWLLLGRTIGVSPVPMGMPEVYLALKTGTIDGQENPLSVMSAAKFYEVTQQVVLTTHMIQPVFINVAKPAWDKLSPAQQAVVQDAAAKAAAANQDGRLADERSIIDALKERKLQVDAIDLAPFRALADKVYADSDAAKAWDAGWMKRVAAA